MPKRKLLFLTLNTFSTTGGIEKVCRVAGSAFSQLCEEQGYTFELYAMNDRPEDLLPAYLPAASFVPFGGRRARFVRRAVAAGIQSEVVVLSHINLLVVGGLIKLLSPKTTVYLIAHGIEVWRPLPRWKRLLLAKMDRILPVSQYTCAVMQRLHQLPPERFTVVNNCLDPFLPPKAEKAASEAVRKLHGLRASDKILFTLTRLKSSEQYKGYDKVIQLLPRLAEGHPLVKYLIAGKYDAAEKERLHQQMRELGVEDRVVFAGMIKDEDIAAYFGAADAYVMPSTGEGFGVVFIEALHYGLPVIAGNADGSVDALAGGKFGVLVNPADAAQLLSAVEEVLRDPNRFVPDDRAVWSTFGFPAYKAALSHVVFKTAGGPSRAGAAPAN